LVGESGSLGGEEAQKSASKDEDKKSPLGKKKREGNAKLRGEKESKEWSPAKNFSLNGPGLGRKTVQGTSGEHGN